MGRGISPDQPDLGGGLSVREARVGTVNHLPGPSRNTPTRRRIVGLVAAAAVLGVLLAGCRLPVTTAQGTSGAGVAVVEPVSAGAGRPVLTDRGWDAAGLHGPAPAAGSCRLRASVSGEWLPDPVCTPGAVDRAVTAANIEVTICRKGGYTAGVRSPQHITDAAKKKVMAAYGIPFSQAPTVELDHEIDLTAGGSSDYRNLRPEPDTFSTATPSAYIHNQKDAGRGVHVPRHLRPPGAAAGGAERNGRRLEHRGSGPGSTADAGRLPRMTGHHLALLTAAVTTSVPAGTASTLAGQVAGPVAVVVAVVVGGLLVLILVWLGRKVLHKLVGAAAGVAAGVAVRAGVHSWISDLVTTHLHT